MRRDRKAFNSSFGLWETQFTERYEVDKMAYTRSINRFFRNFIACCYNSGSNQRLYLERLKNEHGIGVSWDRVRELAGLGRWAGLPYKGYLSFEWLFAISVFCGKEWAVMFNEDFELKEETKATVLNYWAGSGKGMRAGGDLKRTSFPEAINHKR